MITFSSRKKPSAPQVKALYRHAWWAKDRQISKIRQMLSHTDLLFTCWEGAALVGLARVNTDYAFRAVLFDVIVDPRFHRQGLGTRLVENALAHPDLRQVEQFWLYTTDKQAFYERFGFRQYPENVMILKKAKP